MATAGTNGVKTDSQLSFKIYLKYSLHLKSQNTEELSLQFHAITTFVLILKQDRCFTNSLGKKKKAWALSSLQF